MRRPNNIHISEMDARRLECALSLAIDRLDSDKALYGKLEMDEAVDRVNDLQGDLADLQRKFARLRG